MRFIGFLSVVLLAVSCGNPSRTRATFNSSLLPPSLMALSPSAAPANTTPFIMTVNGANFGTDAVVFWNGTPQSTRFVGPSQLLVSVTDEDLMQFGMAQVFVRTGGLNTNTLDFDVTAQ
jgi:hypothetical protein